MTMFGWFKKSPPLVAESAVQYLLLYREGRHVFAADVSYLLVGDEYPSVLEVGGHRYRRVDDENTFIFWDELRDASNRTVGYTFLMPDSPVFAKAPLWTDSENAEVENGEVRLHLQGCVNPRWECVQGFGSELYQSETNHRDCLFVLFNWSRNQEAFELRPGPGGERIDAA